MAPLRLKSSPSLFVGEQSNPLPTIVATTKSIPRKNIAQQAAAFTAVVARSLEAAVKRSANFPLGLLVAACLEETLARSTANGFLVVKFTIVNPAILDNLAALTDSSPLLPIQKPNPGFQEIRLSWENRIGRYYRTLNVPHGVAVEGLVNSINAVFPCKYVEPLQGPGGFAVTGHHVVEFTVSSATDIPAEITIPHPTRGKKPFLIRVTHVPNVDHKIALGLSKLNVCDWDDAPGIPSWLSAAPQSSPARSNGPVHPPSGRTNNKKAPAPAGAPISKTSSKVFQQMVNNAAAQYTHMKQQVAKNARLEAEKIAAAARVAAEAEAQAVIAAAEALKASELYVKNFVKDCIAAAFGRHAPEEAALVKKAAPTANAAEFAAAAVAGSEALNKRGRAPSDSEEDEDDGVDIRMNSVGATKTPPKKAKETAGDGGPSPMVA
jgi:hypothetical protein